MKILKYLFMMLLTVSLGTTTVSCSKDSNENESSSINGASIVGTWKMTMEEDGDLGYCLMVFNSNGIGYSEEWGYYQGVPILDSRNDFKYQYNSSKNELKRIYEYGEETYYCEVTDTRMIIRFTKKGQERTNVFVRQ